MDEIPEKKLSLPEPPELGPGCGCGCGCGCLLPPLKISDNPPKPPDPPEPEKPPRFPPKPPLDPPRPPSEFKMSDKPPLPINN